LRKFGFHKSERIYLKKELESFYDKKNLSNKFSFAHPIKCIYADLADADFSRILITVPKRKFKKAVDRNLLKRRIREAYRKNKHILEKAYLINFTYISDEAYAFEAIVTSVIRILTDINKGIKA
jgi:ribonuclease P protein component